VITTAELVAQGGGIGEIPADLAAQTIRTSAVADDHFQTETCRYPLDWTLCVGNYRSCYDYD